MGYTFNYTISALDTITNRMKRTRIVPVEVQKPP